MADEGAGTLDERTENAALGAALAAEHAAIWGYGVVGAALDVGSQALARSSETAHRDVRDEVVALLAGRAAEPAGAEGGYTLPFPVLSAVDAAALAATLEDGVASAWVRVLDQAGEREVRELAVEGPGATGVPAVGRRAAAGGDPGPRGPPRLPGR